MKEEGGKGISEKDNTSKGGMDAIFDGKVLLSWISFISELREEEEED